MEKGLAALQSMPGYSKKWPRNHLSEQPGMPTGHPKKQLCSHLSEWPGAVHGIAGSEKWLCSCLLAQPDMLLRAAPSLSEGWVALWSYARPQRPQGPWAQTLPPPRITPGTTSMAVLFLETPQIPKSVSIQTQRFGPPPPSKPPVRFRGFSEGCRGHIWSPVGFRMPISGGNESYFWFSGKKGSDIFRPL